MNDMKNFSGNTLSYKKVFWGIVLIALGIVIMLKNLNVIWFSWHSLWALWPVLFILWGISILPIKDYLKLIISLVAVAIGVSIVSTHPEINAFGFNWHRHNHDWEVTYDHDSTFTTNENFSEPYDKAIKEGTLYLDAAAGNFTMTDTTNSLYDFKKSGGRTQYQTSVEKDSSSAVIRLKLKDGSFNSGNGGEAHIKLNMKPVWNINFSVGAADLHMDLSKYKVRTIKVEGGASSVNLKIGELNDDQTVKISAGASSIHIMVPKSRACEVKTNTVLSSRELPGFDRIERHLYRTSNYNTAKIRTTIDVDAAVSSLNVERY
ncbi:MAG: DUF5668 domain-containing protein [Bacteroidota bacterium]|nr:DUF5668 domain-containing protein [Bacteroidota bacterium]